MIKIFFGLIAIGITFCAFFIYIRSILNGNTKPHIFSWIIWGATTFIVFLAQLSDGGGIGAWPIGLSGLMTLGVAWLAYQKRGEISITHTDWICFAMALLSIPLWYITANPLWAVIILTTINLMGFVPTYRKSYHAPFSEPPIFILLMCGRNAVSIIALEHYSLTTVVFPATMVLACSVLVTMIFYRRRATY